ncbi:conjugal transfer protein TraD [Oryzicola mucosus]|nr:conjugal transfer protein TraD [Oryzicola mucosus]
MAKKISTEARKKDTHEKIQLGGLIAKAGLRYEKRALLLGLLIDGASRIKADDAERRRLLEIGEKAFASDAD